MNRYVGVMLVKATPTTLGEFFMTINDTEGYKVEFKNTTFWLNKEDFESTFFKLTVDNKIEESDVVRFMNKLDAQKVDEKTTLVKATSLTGFVQYETSSCVDPANFDMELGKKYATENLVSKFWSNLGFVLQWAKNGLRNE